MLSRWIFLQNQAENVQFFTFPYWNQIKTRNNTWHSNIHFLPFDLQLDNKPVWNLFDYAKSKRCERSSDILCWQWSNRRSLDKRIVIVTQLLYKPGCLFSSNTKTVQLNENVGSKLSHPFQWRSVFGGFARRINAPQLKSKLARRRPQQTCVGSDSYLSVLLSCQRNLSYCRRFFSTTRSFEPVSFWHKGPNRKKYAYHLHAHVVETYAYLSPTAVHADVIQNAMDAAAK